MSLETLKTRIDYLGGDSLNRIKQQKLKSFYAALKEDYNSRTILTPLGEEFQALINDDNTKSDYDKRYISVDYAAQLGPGDVFECIDDQTHWMIYLQDLVEIAYFKAEIIRCRYQLTINNKNYWIYFQGPTETTIRWNLKKNITWNDLNFSGTIYIQKNEETQNYFNRFDKIKVDGHTWQVKVVDTLTVPGIIELEVNEYFDSLTEDLAEIHQVDVQNNIIGPQKVYYNTQVVYQINDNLFNDEDQWEIVGEGVEIYPSPWNDISNQYFIVSITQNADNIFYINYGTESLTVQVIGEKIVSKPFSIIGNTEVYPYEIYYYYLDSNSLINGYFTVNNENIKIISQAANHCTIEIQSTKKDDFILSFHGIQPITVNLPIKVLSL